MIRFETGGWKRASRRESLGEGFCAWWHPVELPAAPRHWWRALRPRRKLAGFDAMTLYRMSGVGLGLTSLDDLDGARKRARELAERDGAGLVSADPVTVSGRRGFRLIRKLPQDPCGMSYRATIEVPVDEAAIVVDVHCREFGVTGLRDAAVFQTLVSEGGLELDDAADTPAGWFEDPYDPGRTAEVLRNRADDRIWDARFPAHPLSRLRRHLRRIERKLRVE